MDLGEKARLKLKEFVEQVDPKIGTYLDSEMNKKFGFNRRQQEVVQEMLAHSKEYMLRPTKRIRSAFIKYGFELGGSSATAVVDAAGVGIELVHAALLMHDDFMDSDLSRRGGPTTHVHYRGSLNDDHLGDSMAVSLGDAILCLGFELVAQANNTAATQQLLRGIANTAYGQAYDLSLESFKNWTEDDVITLHKAKTAIYTYENPLFIGAHLAGLSQKALDILHSYAMDGGVAFQLQDDILGVFGTPEKTGKSADSDLKQGKCTLLVLKAMEQEKYKPAILKVWGDPQATRADLDVAKQAITNSGSLDYSKKLAQDLARKAAKTASKLRDLKLNTEAIDFIQGVAEYMVVREV